MHFKHRKNISNHRSGGIALAYKKSLSQYITPIETQSKLVLWFKISKRLTKSEDILGAVIYIPPEASDYAIRFPYQEIENELYTLSDNFSSILFLGDFNSRTKNLMDYIEADKFLYNHFDSDDIVLEFENEMSHFKGSCVNIDRTNSDTNINNYGYRLLDFCKSNTLYILNGRTSRDHGVGALTCKNRSTVDYFLCSSNIFSMISNFYVNDICETLSDVHSPVYLELKCCKTNQENDTETIDEAHINTWNHSKAGEFIGNFDVSSLDTLNINTIQLSMGNSINQNDIDATVDTFCNLILSSAEKTFGKSKPHSSNQHHKKPNKWFGHKCLKARKQFHNARYQYKRRKTLQNKETLKSTSKIYKQTIHFYHTQFKKQNIQKLKKLKRSNPRKYWKILNGKRQEKTEADPDEMFNFFKKSNFDENAESHQNNANQIGENTIHNTSINEPITESEVKKGHKWPQK